MLRTVSGTLNKLKFFPSLIRRSLFVPSHVDPQTLPHSDMVGFTTALNWLLRHGAVQDGVFMRPNGYVRLTDVKNWGAFRHLTPAQFHRLLARENFKRFMVVEDFDPAENAVTKWIRTTQRHSIKSIDVCLKQVRSPRDLPMAIYPTTLERWQYLETHGIPRSEEDNFIHLVGSTPEDNYSHGTAFEVLVYLNVRKTLSRGIPLFLSNKGAVLTTGNQLGVLPPELFHQVLRVSVERETLLQNEAKKKPMGRWQREALNALKYGPRTKGDADTSEQ